MQTSVEKVGACQTVLWGQYWSSWSMTALEIRLGLSTAVWRRFVLGRGVKSCQGRVERSKGVMRGCLGCVETMLLRGEVESCSLRVSSMQGTEEQPLPCEAGVLRAQQPRRTSTKSFSVTQSKGGLV